MDTAKPGRPSPSQQTSLSKSQLFTSMTDDDVLVMVTTDGQFARLKGSAFSALLQKNEELRLQVSSLEERLTKQQDAPRQLIRSALHAHSSNVNAHQVTKVMVGLGSVQDYPIGSLATGREGYVLTSELLTHLAHFAKEAPTTTSSTEGEAITLGSANRCLALDASVIAIGHQCDTGALLRASDVLSIGHGVNPPSNQAVTLGHSKQRLYLAKPLATRGDRRDFRDPEPLALGLDFVLKLHPQVARQDLREDYVDYSTLPLPPLPPGPGPAEPTLTQNERGYGDAVQAYRQAKMAHEVAVTNFENDTRTWRRNYRTWYAANRFDAITPDGSKAAEEKRAVLFADDLKQASSDFTGAHNPADLQQGLDIEMVHSEEIIPVLVKAIQDLHAYITSDTMLEALAARLYERKRTARS